MSLNWSEVQKSVKEGERQRSGGGRRLMLSDGDSADLRLIGAATGKEPFIYKRHYDAKTERYFPCAEDLAKAGKHDGCICCMVARTVRSEGKSARLKSPQRVYVVTAFDPRKYHYLENKPKGQQYQTCSDDDTCRYCRKNIARRINGVRYWEMAENLITQLRQFEVNTLGKRCLKCDNGRIKVTGFVCPVCEEDMEPDGDPNEEIRCIACEKEAGKKPILRKPKEVVSCRNCGPKGRRVSLADAWITVSVSGAKASKTWNFNVGDIEPFDPAPFLKEFPDLKKIVPLNLADMADFQPMSAAEQAAALNVPNPFSKRARSTDDDEEEETPRRRKRPVDDDEDDDDDPPRKKKKNIFDEGSPELDDEDEDKPAKKSKKKYSEDDDDEDDDIF